MIHDNMIITITITTIVVILFIITTSFVYKEFYSYHFGFPTWGSVNNSMIGWGGVRVNPFMVYGYPRRYYYPYLSKRCYTSSKSDHCTPGYRKVKKDTDNDGIKDTFKCCRRF